MGRGRVVGGREAARVIKKKGEGGLGKAAGKGKGWRREVRKKGKGEREALGGGFITQRRRERRERHNEK
jgi:hypothetical protein